MSSDSSFSYFSLFIAIACGVFFGGLGAGLAYTEITAYRLERAASQALSDFNTQQQAAQQRSQEQARATAQAQAQAEMRQRAAQQRAADLARAKQAAWDEFFKPSQVCRDDPARGECADQHIRAKRQFEENWANKNY